MCIIGTAKNKLDLADPTPQFDNYKISKLKKKISVDILVDVSLSPLKSNKVDDTMNERSVKADIKIYNKVNASNHNENKNCIKLIT